MLIETEQSIFLFYLFFRWFFTGQKQNLEMTPDKKTLGNMNKNFFVLLADFGH